MAEDFRQAKFRYIFAHPEHILTKDVVDVLQNKTWQGRVSAIVVDEAHCVVQWGSDFRPCFQNIKSLHALFPKANMVGLTATASIKMQHNITLDLGMKVPR